MYGARGTLLRRRIVLMEFVAAGRPRMDHAIRQRGPRRRRLDDPLRARARPALPPPARVQNHRSPSTPPPLDDRDAPGRLHPAIRDRVRLRGARRRDTDDDDPAWPPYRAAARRARPRRFERVRSARATHPRPSYAPGANVTPLQKSRSPVAAVVRIRDSPPEGAARRPPARCRDGRSGVPRSHKCREGATGGANCQMLWIGGHEWSFRRRRSPSSFHRRGCRRQ